MAIPVDKPFGIPNILTSSEKAKRKQENEASRDIGHFHDYVAGNLVWRRQWVDHRDREVEQAEQESRRYTLLLMQIRQLHPDWISENVRREALRLLGIERSNRELRLSYVPKSISAK